MKHHTLQLLATAAICLLCSASAPAQSNRTIIIHAGKFSRSIAPVTVSLPEGTAINRPLQLKNTRTGKSTPAQVSGGHSLVFILTDTIAAGGKENYLLSYASKTPPRGIVIQQKEHGLQVMKGNKPILFYHTKTAFPGKDTNSYYRRSGFIHPLYTPGASILTDDFPVGHTHQHGLFSAWVNTKFRNEKTDFWNQQQQTGTVMHVSVENLVEGPVFSTFTSKLHSISLKHGVVLEEYWTLRFYHVPGGFLFDLISEQTNISTDTLHLLPYHYGGMAIRGSRAWNKEDTSHFKGQWQVFTAEGIKDSAANHTHPGWVQLTGPAGTENNGLVIFDHPHNLRYPQAIRVHPTMPYLVFSPVADGQIDIPPGGKYNAAYRFFTYDQPPSHYKIRQEEKNWTVPVTSGLSHQ